MNCGAVLWYNRREDDLKSGRTGLEQGTLWQRILQTTEVALQSGALVPIPTDGAFIEDGGIRFSVRMLAGLRKKAEARREQDAAEKAGRSANPFLPPEKDLTVADITAAHVAILNKFNVVPHHLLIITRHFEDQETLLTPADLESLWTCMAEFNGLGFYNGGTVAGASQRHKHLQMVPLPLASEGPDVPVEPLLASARIGDDGFGTVPAFSFRHSFVRLDADLWRMPADAARETFRLYAELLKKVGLRPPAPQGQTLQSMPYCLLVTRRWMLIVPRSREHVGEISLNSLAYAGSLFVYNAALLETLRRYGPMNMLRDAALPL
jgi:sulfate adenylyltransferase (ADP) / ATP adenylyltransferase